MKGLIFLLIVIGTAFCQQAEKLELKDTVVSKEFLSSKLSQIKAQANVIARLKNTGINSNNIVIIPILDTTYKYYKVSMFKIANINFPLGSTSIFLLLESTMINDFEVIEIK